MRGIKQQKKPRKAKKMKRLSVISNDDAIVARDRRDEETGGASS